MLFGEGKIILLLHYRHSQMGIIVETMLIRNYMAFYIYERPVELNSDDIKRRTLSYIRK